MARDKSDTPSFSNIGNLNFSSGNVGGNLDQTIHADSNGIAINWTDVRTALAALQEMLNRLDVPDEAKSEAAADISTSLAQAQKKAPDKEVIRHSLQTALKTIEVFAHASGATLFLQKIMSLLGML
jgi:ABC-type branched-subunit amino acid transport system substrate-binding protein